MHYLKSHLIDQFDPDLDSMSIELFTKVDLNMLIDSKLNFDINLKNQLLSETKKLIMLMNHSYPRFKVVIKFNQLMYYCFSLQVRKTISMNFAHRLFD